MEQATFDELFGMVKSIHHHFMLDSPPVSIVDFTEEDDEDCSDLPQWHPKNNKPSPLRNTPHGTAINRLLASDSKIQRGSFAYQIWKAFRVDRIGLHEILNNRVPDAFKIDERVVTIYEIEDTSRLKENKLRDYLFLWDFLRGEEIELRLAIGNIHGITMQYIDMMDAYWDMVRRDVENHRKVVDFGIQ